MSGLSSGFDGIFQNQQDDDDYEGRLMAKLGNNDKGDPDMISLLKTFSYDSDTDCVATFNGGKYFSIDEDNCGIHARSHKKRRNATIMNREKHCRLAIVTPETPQITNVEISHDSTSDPKVQALYLYDPSECKDDNTNPASLLRSTNPISSTGLPSKPCAFDDIFYHNVNYATATTIATGGSDSGGGGGGTKKDSKLNSFSKFRSVECDDKP